MFSRKRVTGATEQVSSLLGNQGYAFANVNTVPELDDEKHEVSLGFFIDPGHRVYVRRINIAGNTGTRDEVVRRELRQMEGGWFSAEKVDRSRARISRLGYFEDVNVETQPVPGTTDQLDVNYSVSETSSGSVSAGLGFSQSSGLLFNASITQDNVLGSGKRMSLTFNNSEFSQIYSFSYVNPYWTVDGISRGFGAFYSKVDADEANLADYTTDTRGADVNFGVPLNETDRFRFSVGYQGLDIKSNIPGDTIEQCIAGTNLLPCSEVAFFIGKHGDTFDDAVFTFSWSHDSRNRALFTDYGATQSLSLETTSPGSGLEYYKIDYRQQRFVPLTRDLTLSLKGRVGYGDGFGDFDQLPFFENFFAGGTRSVRGFRDNTLGPRTRVENDPLGGSFLLTFSSEVFFPVPFLDDSSGMRLGAFVDVGNVFKDFNAFDAGDLRYSIGLSGLWVSPLGPLSVSVALPLNDEDDDDVQNFQFNVGSFF
ncbi:MAG: outer membrane protein assembly factor BamA [Deltaproteobacteria bacterium]|nr:outer membrane protein assembly factor BamA [Deltaproteobacteria bacterium]